MVSLTDRQQNDLNEAVLRYLQARNLPQTVAAFKEESGVGQQPPDPKLDGLLEKKWVAVIRLQKKVLELEGRIEALREEIRSTPAERAASIVDWVPNGTAHHTFAGHRAPITRVAFHPVFSLIATASEDSTVKIWDWETGEFERTLTGHTREVKDVDFDPLGRFLASASSDLTIRLWDTDAWDTRGYSGQSLYGHDHTISCARFLPSGDFIVSASRDKTIKIWEVATKFCVRTIAAHDDWVRFVVPSDDNRLLGSCSNDHKARIWEYKTGEMKSELRGHDRQVEVVVFVPVNSYPYIRTLIDSQDTIEDAGAYVVTGARDNLIMLWETQSGRHLKTLVGHDGWIRGLDFHPTGKFLISASDDKHMRVWDLATGRCTRTIEAHSHFVTCIAWGTATVGGGPSNGRNAGETGDGRASLQRRRVNVVATGGVDLLAKIWTPRFDRDSRE